MEQEITYKLKKEDLIDMIPELRRMIKNEFLSKYNNKIIDVETVAKIHGVHPHTVRYYAKKEKIKCEPRVEHAPFWFRLGDALEFDFNDLEKTLRNKNLKSSKPL